MLYALTHDIRCVYRAFPKDKESRKSALVFMGEEMKITPKEVREAMKRYKAEGHTNKEVATKFKVNYETTKAICRGIANQNRSAEKKFLEEFNNRFGSLATVIGEFKSVDSKLLVKCNRCGYEWQYPCGSLRRGHGLNCPKCKETERQEKIANEIEAKHKRIEESKRKKLAKEKEHKEREQAKWHDCPVCGKYTNRKLYCSDKCAKRHMNAIREARRRTRIEEQLVDKDITLSKLYRRDKGLCWLCGLQCNWEDYERRGNIYIAGNFYPSIDHVKPISKGGLHSWSNVKLAHIHCNTIKRDKTTF